MSDTGFVQAMDSLVAEMNARGDVWGVNYKSWAGAFCKLCAEGLPVAYYGDGSGFAGYVHRIEGQIGGAGSVQTCGAQEIQRRLHAPSSWIAA